MFISGQPGTGKTSLVENIISKEKEKDKSTIFEIQMNCMSITGTSQFYEVFNQFLISPKTIEFLKNNLSDKEFKNYQTKMAEANLFDILSTIKRLRVIIVLDEIDHLYNKKEEMAFYNILNIPYLSSGNIKMILISNNSDFDSEIFPKLENRNYEEQITRDWFIK